MMLTLGRGLSPISRGVINTDPSLKKSIPSCVFDLDATLSASYPGSGQSWLNLVAAPADGSAQSAYDFMLGASGSAGGDDPGFTGSAGAASAYFVLDGGDYFTLSGANTAFINALHKSTGGTDFWFAIALRYQDVASSIQYLMGTIGGTQRGIGVYSSGADRLSLIQLGDASSVASNSVKAFTFNGDCAAIVSYSAASGAVRFWLNDRSKEEKTLTFDTTTQNPLGPLYVCTRYGASARLVNGTRIYAFAMGNAFLDDAAAGKILDTYNARHGRTYG